MQPLSRSTVLPAARRCSMLPRTSVATIMVTHDHDVLHHVDRVLILEDGRIEPHTGS